MVQLNLTSSFDGIALPSKAVSPQKFYDFTPETSGLNITNSTNQTILEVGKDDDHIVTVGTDQDIMIDQNLFAQQKM